METLVPGRMPRAGLLLLPLLLCFRPDTARSIDPNVLKKIVNYVTEYGVNDEYAFAVSLDRRYCRNEGFLEDELPETDLEKMQEAINQMGGLYDPDEGHIVAARMRRLNSGAGQHAEWRLLQGDQNSPVQKLLARTYNESSCLIFFTLYSPCVRTCLWNNGPYNILDMVKKTFSSIANNAKAFVFWNIYPENNVIPQMQLQAWLRLRQVPVPLLRCNNNLCKPCFRNNNINCLHMT